MHRYVITILLVLTCHAGFASGTAGVEASRFQQTTRATRIDNPIKEAALLEAVGDDHAEWQRSDKADESYRKALDLLEGLPSQRAQFKRADILLKLADVTDDAKSKLRFARQAHAINESFPDSRRKELGKSLTFFVLRSIARNSIQDYKTYSERLESIYKSSTPGERSPVLLFGHLAYLFFGGSPSRIEVESALEEALGFLTAYLNKPWNIGRRLDFLGYCGGVKFFLDFDLKYLPRVIELQERCVASMDPHFAATHPALIELLRDLASLYMRADNYVRADEVLQEIETRYKQEAVSAWRDTLSSQVAEAAFLEADSSTELRQLAVAQLKVAERFLAYFLGGAGRLGRSEAEVFYLKALNVVSAPDYPFDADTAFWLGTVSKQAALSGSLVHARVLIEQSITNRKKAAEPDIAWLASDMTKYAQVLFKLEEYRAAEDSLWAVIDTVEASDRKHYTWAAKAYVDLAALYALSKRTSEIQGLLNRFDQYVAAKIPAAAGAHDDVRSARARMLSSLGNTDAAIALWDALVIDYKTDANAAKLVVTWLLNKSELLASSGHGVEAISDLEEAHRILAATGLKDVQAGEATRMLSYQYRQQGRLSDATGAWLARGKDREYERLADEAINSGLVFELMEQAKIQFSALRSDEWELLHAIAIIGRMSAGRTKTQSIDTIATHLCDTNRASEGVAMVERAISEINEFSATPSSRGWFATLGRCKQRQGNHAEAIAAFEKEIEIERGVDDSESTLLEALLLGNIGREFYFLKDNLRAIEAFDQSLELFSSYASEHKNIAITYFYRKQALAAIGRDAEASADAQKAAVHLSKIDQSDRRDLRNQALYSELGRFGGNEPLANQSPAAEFHTVASSLAEELRRPGSKTLFASGTYQIELRAAATRQLQMGWDIHQQNKSFDVLNDSFVLAQSMTQSSTESGLIQSIAETSAPSSMARAIVRNYFKDESHWLQARQHFVRAWEEPNTERAWRLARNALRMSAESSPFQNLTVLEEVHPGVGEILAPKPVTVTDLQSFLRPEQALLFIRTTENETHLWAVTKRSAVWLKLPVHSLHVSDLTKRIKASLDPELLLSQTYDYRAAYELYRAIFQPAEKFLSGISEVISVTDGVLATLPLGILIQEMPPEIDTPDVKAYRAMKWLIDRYSFSTLPSVSSLRLLRGFEEKNREKDQFPFLGIGNPVLGNLIGPGQLQSGGHVSSRGNTLQPLPAERAAAQRSFRNLPALPDTEAELVEIAEIMGSRKSNLLLGKEATETNLKRHALEKYRVIGIATHGIVSSEIDGVKEPGLVLTRPALSSHEDDGYLAASEIASLKLDADWVILSGCNTAAPTGGSTEPMSGLAKAFFAAGARSLLVSNWSVVSSAARTLVSDTIRNYIGDPSGGRSAALRSAMLKMINDDRTPEFAHPAVWGPFTVVGVGN